MALWQSQPHLLFSVGCWELLSVAQEGGVNLRKPLPSSHCPHSGMGFDPSDPVGTIVNRTAFLLMGSEHSHVEGTLKTPL